MPQESHNIASEYRGYAAAFQDQSVVEAYRHRLPYPAETFEILMQLLRHKPTSVLDVGCGRGELARQFVERVERVDAVDFSRSMIEQGKWKSSLFAMVRGLYRRCAASISSNALLASTR